MKKLMFTIVSAFLFKAHLFSQIPSPGVEKLTVNSSPAFILLGVQPENIQRPSTPRDFLANVQSAFVNQQLQPNFALETNPFNWKKNQFSNQFYANDYFYRHKGAIKRNLALSLATSTSDTTVFGDLEKGLGLSYGARVTLVPGKVNKVVRDLVIDWEFLDVESQFYNLLHSQINIDASKINDQLIDQYVSIVAKKVKSGKIDTMYILQDNEKDILNRLNTIATSYRGLNSSELNVKNTTDRATIAAKKKAALAKINSLNTKTSPFDREGFILELAAAGVTVFQENQWQKSHFGKAAVWLTPSYRLTVPKDDPNDLTQSLDFMAVFRYIWNDKKVDIASYFDLGGKLQFNRTKWTASFEIVARHASKVPETVSSSWTNSWLFSVSYTMVESASVKFSFGSQFDGNTTKYSQPGEMFVVGGINLGFIGRN